jgi:hypothetical protein
MDVAACFLGEIAERGKVKVVAITLDRLIHELPG